MSGITLPKADAMRLARLILAGLTPDEIAQVLRPPELDDELMARGLEMLGDEAAVIQWFRSPARALGGLLPYEAVRTPEGREQVERLMLQLIHGVYP
jgi:uncharacterized protein (DUF2384 family)